MVDTYISVSDNLDDVLLTYDNYVDGTHPDISEEKVMTEAMMLSCVGQNYKMDVSEGVLK